jgi:8-oxo-dGTP pyrophosphatase MutT (NUDIX family)
MLIKHPYDTVIPGKTQASFLALMAESQIYIDYKDKDMDETQKNAWYPVVLMFNRWDSKIGFVGGKVDKNETVTQAVIREAREEANLWIFHSHLTGVCCHETDTMALYFHKYSLGRVDVMFLRDIIEKAAKAKNSVSEGNVFWAHLSEYALPTLLNSNNLATAVKEELLEILPGV